MSTEMKPIILYDIPCITPGRPWSPNGMKTRYCLGYKGLPFTTVWVELPDIAGLLQSKGIAQPPYTLPATEDPNTGTFVTDSLAIATYLDEAYPETPKVLTPLARVLVEDVEVMFSLGSGGALKSHAGTNASVGPSHGQGTVTTSTDSDLAPRLVFVVLGTERLNEVSRAYYHQTRMPRLGERWTMLSDACAAGVGSEVRAECVRQGIEAIRGAWGELTAMYEHLPVGGVSELPGSGGPFIHGEQPCFVDFAIAGRVKFVLDGLNASEEETVKNLEGGRLMRLVESMERYFKY